MHLESLFLFLGAAVCDWLCVLYKHFYCCLYYLPLLLQPFDIQYEYNEELENVLDACYLPGCAPWEPFPSSRCSSVWLAQCVLYKTFNCCLKTKPLLFQTLSIYYESNKELENVLHACYFQGCEPQEPIPSIRCSSVWLALCVVQTFLLLPTLFASALVTFCYPI